MEGLDNVAPGKTVIQSSTQSGSQPQHVIDLQAGKHQVFSNLTSSLQ